MLWKLTLLMFQDYIPATYIRFACFSTLGLVYKVTLRGLKIRWPAVYTCVWACACDCVGTRAFGENNSKTKSEKIKTIFPSFKTFSKVLQIFSDDL